MKNKTSISHKQLKQFLSPTLTIAESSKILRPRGIRPTKSLLDSQLVRPKPLKKLKTIAK